MINDSDDDSLSNNDSNDNNNSHSSNELGRQDLSHMTAEYGGPQALLHGEAARRLLRE